MAIGVAIDAPASVRAMMVTLAIFVGAIALGILVVGHFLWKGVNWARITFIFLLLVGSALTVFGMPSGVDAKSVISIVGNLIFVVILSSASAKNYCGSFQPSASKRKKKRHEGKTVEQFFNEKMPGRKAHDFLIRVNRQPVSRDYVLQENDRVTITPLKIEGASA